MEKWNEARLHLAGYTKTQAILLGHTWSIIGLAMADMVCCAT